MQKILIGIGFVAVMAFALIEQSPAKGPPVNQPPGTVLQTLPSSPTGERERDPSHPTPGDGTCELPSPAFPDDALLLKCTPDCGEGEICCSPGNCYQGNCCTSVQCGGEACILHWCGGRVPN